MKKQDSRGRGVSGTVGLRLLLSLLSWHLSLPSGHLHFLICWKPSKMSLDPHGTKISIPFHNRGDGMRSERTSFSQSTGRTQAGREVPASCWPPPARAAHSFFLSAAPLPCSSWHPHCRPTMLARVPAADSSWRLYSSSLTRSKT